MLPQVVCFTGALESRSSVQTDRVNCCRRRSRVPEPMLPERPWFGTGDDVEQRSPAKPTSDAQNERPRGSAGLQLWASCVSDPGKLDRKTPALRRIWAEPRAFAVTPVERLVSNP